MNPLNESGILAGSTMGDRASIGGGGVSKSKMKVDRASLGLDARIYDQIPPPVECKMHGTFPILQHLNASMTMEDLGDTERKCRRKVQNYDALALSRWRALFTLSHTVIVDPSTYSLLLFLAVVSVASFVVLNVSGLDRSIEDDGIVTGRLMYLLSFILAGHVSIATNRWYQIRHQVFGPLWGGLENMFLLACQLSPDNAALQETVLRQVRLTMRLVFAAAQGGERDSLADLLRDGLLLPEESAVLDQLLIGTRPFTSAMWLSRALEEEHAAVVESKQISLLMQQTFAFTLQQNLLQVKGGVGGTLGYVGCPIPFVFVHLVNWTVVFSLCTLSVSTGVMLAIGWRRRDTGNNQYVPDADDPPWPLSPNNWFINFALTYSLQTVLYGVFSLGLVRICAKMHNPFSQEDCSFPESSYDAFLHNNCRAMQVGVTSPRLIKSVPVTPTPSVGVADVRAPRLTFEVTSRS